MFKFKDNVKSEKPKIASMQKSSQIKMTKTKNKQNARRNHIHAPSALFVKS